MKEQSMASIPPAFGKYSLIAELGHGGMADVFLAVAQGPAGFSKLHVIKQLRASLRDDPEFVTMLLDEARIAARLNHPNVVQTYEIGQVDQIHFIAMEYLSGQPLHRIIARAQKEPCAFDAYAQYGVLADVLGGLHHAHELRDYDGTPLNVVHRDVSPHNVFVTYEGQVKVVDFGIAKAAGRMSAATAEGTIKGKVRYMAPEQAFGREVDRRADVFSVGVMLWTAATSKRMWGDRDEMSILTALLAKEIPASPRAVVPEVPERIDAICRRALAYEPSERFATAAEMQAELEDFLASSGKKLSARQLGQAIGPLFEADQEEVRQVIERQVLKLSSPSAPYSLASIMPESSVSSNAAAVSSTLKRRFVKEAIARGAVPGVAGRRERESEPTRSAALDPHTAQTVTLSTEARQQVRAAKRRRSFLVGGVALTAVVGIAGFVTLRHPASGDMHAPEAAVDAAALPVVTATTAVSTAQIAHEAPDAAAAPTPPSTATAMTNPGTVRPPGGSQRQGFRQNTRTAQDPPKASASTAPTTTTAPTSTRPQELDDGLSDRH